MKVTVRDFYKKKAEHQKITMLTAYDYPTAQMVDERGSMRFSSRTPFRWCVQGIENTLPVTMDEMIYHTRMVSRAVKNAMVIGDCHTCRIRSASKKHCATRAASSRRAERRQSS